MMGTMRRAFARGLGHGSRRPPLSGTPPRARLVRAPHLNEDLLEEAYVRRGTAERGPAPGRTSRRCPCTSRGRAAGGWIIAGGGGGIVERAETDRTARGAQGDDDARERERPGACLGLARRGLGVRAGGVAGVLGGHHRERRDGGSGGRTRRARSKRRGRLLFLSLGTPVGAALGRTETEQAPNERKKRRGRKTPTRTGTGRANRRSRVHYSPPAPLARRSPPSPSRLRRACHSPRAPTPSRASLPRPSPRTARPATSRRAPLPPRRAPRRRRPRPARRRVRETSRVSPSALAIDRSPHAHHDRTALSRRPPPCPPRPNPRSPRTCTPSSASPRRRRPRRSSPRVPQPHHQGACAKDRSPRRFAIAPSATALLLPGASSAPSPPRTLTLPHPPPSRNSNTRIRAATRRRSR